MRWDLGRQGLVVLGAISLGFGMVSALLVGRGWARGIWALCITTLACFGAGLLTSEWLFGWATEQDLQPNVDGLSRDEVLLSSLITTAVVVVAMRYVARRSHGDAHLWGHHSRPAGHT